jgi:hypothetical protein
MKKRFQRIGEQITEDTLAYYGTSQIKLRMIDKKTLHLEF